MKYLCHISILACYILVLTSTSFSQAQPDWYPFVQPWNDSLTAGNEMRFFPSFNRERAGVHGFLKTSSDGKFVFEDGTAMKFVGVNFSFGASMSDSNIARQVSARLAKFGINVVRMHHMDNYNYWDPRETIISIPSNGSDTRHLNSVQVLRLGYMINQLAENGIYSNINLNVSRQFQLSDGVVNADSLPSYGKIVSIFDPRIRVLMKEYAKNLLTSINLSTGKKFADDPRIAFVEISNENSLYAAWRYGALNHMMTPDWNISFYHEKMLDSMWIAWLQKKYSNTQEVQSAWAGTTGSPIMNEIVNGSFEQAPSKEWQLEVHSYAGAEASFQRTAGGTQGNYCGQINLNKVTGTEWHIQFKQVGTCKIIKDSQYTVTFSARSSHPHRISIGMMKDNANYDNYGLARQVDLSTEWKTFRISFRANATDSISTRLTFTIGQDTGFVWFDDIRFTSLDLPALFANESLEAGTIRRISGTEGADVTTKRLQETAEFIISIQKDFFDDMRNYLRDSIGVKCPISGTNWYFGLGDLYPQKDMDYIDNHAYWQHPIFPNQPWDAVDWYIQNTPMTNDSSLGTMPSLAAHAIKNKPYVVSEYNHPAPNWYQCEMLLHLAAYASLQDWDGLYIYAYHHGHDNWNHQHINGFFDVDGNPIVLSLLPQMSQIFRNEFVAPASEQTDLEFARTDLYSETILNTGKLFFSGLSYAIPLVRKIRVKNFDAQKTPDPDLYNIPQIHPPYQSDTKEINWNTNSTLLTINSSHAFGMTGVIPKAGLRIGYPGSSFIQNIWGEDKFCSLLWTPVDGNDLSHASRSIMTVIGRAENTGMIWEGSQTVHNNWGTSPALIEPQKIEILFSQAHDAIKVFPLDSLGRVIKDSLIFLPLDENGFNHIIIDQNKYRTPWFGVERNFIPVTVRSEKNVEKDFTLSVFPNPSTTLLQIQYNILTRSYVTLELRDVLGRIVKRISNQEMNMGSNVIQMNISDIPAGNYFVRLNSKNVHLSKLITVTRL